MEWSGSGMSEQNGINLEWGKNIIKKTRKESGEHIFFIINANRYYIS